jgi:hypothetical protein
MIRIFEHSAKDVRVLGTDILRDVSVAYRCDRRSGVRKPLHYVHQVCALISHVAAGVGPEVPPVAYPHRLEIMLRRVALKSLPVDLAGQRGVVKRGAHVPVPLRFYQRHLPEHTVVNHFLGGMNLVDRAPLHTDLNDAIRLTHGIDHLEALLKGRRKRFLQIDVLLRIERGVEHRSMMMIGAGDQHGINPGLSQQFSILNVRLCLRMLSLRPIHVRGVDLSDRDALSAQLLKNLADVSSPAAGGDEPKLDLVVRAKCGTWDEQWSGNSCFDELSSIH